MRILSCLGIFAFVCAENGWALAANDASSLRMAENLDQPATAPVVSTQNQGTAENAVPPLTLPGEAILTTPQNAPQNVQQSAPQNNTQSAPQNNTQSAPQNNTQPAPQNNTQPATQNNTQPATQGLMPQNQTTENATSGNATSGNATSGKAAGSDVPYTLDGVPSFNPWQAGSVTVLFLAAFGLVGMSIVRVRKGKNYKTSKQEKPMEVVSTMSVGPKRQLMIVRIRDQEIVIASTETGISMLTDVTEKIQRPVLADMRPLAQLTKSNADFLMPSKELKASSSRDFEDTGSKKSEMLLKALSNLKEKKELSGTRNSNAADESRTTGESGNTANSRREMDFGSVGDSAERNDSTRGIDAVERDGKRTPTLPINKTGFNKFFAKAFEEEAGRSISKSNAAKSSSVKGSSAKGSSANNDAAEEQEESVENVTKMIREKLKNMQPAGH